MAEIRVTSSSLKEKAEVIKSVSSNMQQVDRDIKSEIDKIKPVWTGEASDKAYERYTKVAEELSGIYSSVEQYSGFLERAAEEFAEAEAKTVSSNTVG